MSVAVRMQQKLSADDLLRPGIPEKFVELIEGELVQMTPADWEHNLLASEMQWLFREFCKNHPHVWHGGDTDGFVIERDPDSVLSPDASLFSKRPTKTRPWRYFSPEIVVEVLSPSTTERELTLKRHRYFRAGTEQFWLVDLLPRQIRFYYSDGRIVTVAGEETYIAEGIAAGLSVNLPELFRVLDEA